MLLFVVRRESTGKELGVVQRLLGLNLKRRRRFGGRRGIGIGMAVGQLLGHLLDMIGGRVNVHDGVQGTLVVLYKYRSRSRRVFLRVS